MKNKWLKRTITNDETVTEQHYKSELCDSQLLLDYISAPRPLPLGAENLFVGPASLSAITKNQQSNEWSCVFHSNADLCPF